MPDISRNAPCPCGSGRKYKHCHGAASTAGAPSLPAGSPTAPGAPGGASELENPFRRIFKEDGTLNEPYVRSRLEHLEGLLKENSDFFPIRVDRDEMERILSESQGIFSESDDQEGFTRSFRKFAEVALPELITKEFDERAKETLGDAIGDEKLSPRDRAAAACGMVLTLPAEGEAPQPPHDNPFFDMVLRTTFNESMARVEFFQGLAKEEELSDTEREAKLQEFFRSVPALMFEIQEEFQRHVKRALDSFERGEFSFGIGLDMALHGLQAVRRLTLEYEQEEGEAFTDNQQAEFTQKFGQALSDSFAQDIGEDEELELFDRMVGFLEEARASGAKKAAKGLSSALEVMERNPEVRHRMLYAAYHEAVTGRRMFREEVEEETAREIFEDPFEVERYLAYGECLEAEGHPRRAERVYRTAMEFFPEDEEVRRRLEAVAVALEPERTREVVERIREIEQEEEEGIGAE